ncbi:hypothetical protein N9611_00590 [Flavobacteriaceae bacterium]|nr:hypothetical protein [Flavobacteriaceae bacterium]
MRQSLNFFRSFECDANEKVAVAACLWRDAAKQLQTTIVFLR